MVSFMGRASKKVPISNYYTEFPRISDMMSLFPVLYLVRCEKCCLLSYRCVLCLFSFIYKWQNLARPIIVPFRAKKQSCPLGLRNGK